MSTPSRDLFASVGVGSTRRRSGLRRLLFAPGRPLFELLRPRGAAAGLTDIGGDLVALGDDGSALGLGDWGAVDVAQHVALTWTPAGCEAGGEGGGEVAQRRVVVFAGLDDEAVVAGGELRVDAAQVVGGEVERLAQSGVTGLG